MSAVEVVVVVAGIGAAAFVIWYFLPGGFARPRPAAAEPEREGESVAEKPIPSRDIRLQVRGMTCENCVRHVRKALESVPGVRDVEVVLDPGSARITVGEDGPDAGVLAAAVNDAGYEARPEEI